MHEYSYNLNAMGKLMGFCACGYGSLWNARTRAYFLFDALYLFRLNNNLKFKAIEIFLIWVNHIAFMQFQLTMHLPASIYAHLKLHAP